MAKHIWIIGESMDELDGGKNGVTFVWKKLENRAVLAANDYAIVYKCDRRGEVVAANRRRPERSPVAKIPKAEDRVIVNRSNSGMTNVELKCNERLWRSVSHSTQNQRNL